VHLTLQLGYFKAKRQFFVYAQDAVLEDLRHVLDRIFREGFSVYQTPSRPTRLEQQRIILKLFDYRSVTVRQGRTGAQGAADRQTVDPASLYPA